MPNRKLVYEVGTDTSDAVRDLRKLGDAGRDAGRDLAKGLGDGFDDAESAGTKALATLGAKLDDLEGELKGTASAVKAIGANLGDGFDSSRIEGMVGDLRKMGLTFEEIEQDAKSFADVVQRADGIKLDAVNSGLTKVGGNLESVGHEADQSRSVLANMAGNSAQDLGELGGVVGTLGVGLGQIAEYATEGNIKLANLAQVAGPMAAMAAASLLLAKGLEGTAKANAFDKARAESFTEALKEGGTAAQALYDTVAETGKLEVSTDGLFGLFGGVDDILPLLHNIGLQFADFQNLVADPVAREQMIAYWQALADGASDATTKTNYLRLIQGVEDYVGAIASATEQQEKLNEFMNLTPAMVQDSAGAFREARDFTDGYSDAWATLVGFLESGGMATAETAAAMELLTEASGKTQDEIWSIVQSKLDEKLDAAAEAAAKTGESMRDAADGVGDFAGAVADANRVMASADFDAAGLAAAGEAVANFLTETTVPRDVIDNYAALDDAFTSIAEHGVIDEIMTPEGRQQAELIARLGQTYVPRIEYAFERAGGSLSQFRTEMDRVGQGVQHELIEQFMGLGQSFEEAEGNANTLMQQMGLIPQNVTTMYMLMGDADARAKLELLQGSIDALPDTVQIRIGAAVAAGDFTAALRIARTAFSGGVTTPVHADLDPFVKDVENLRYNMKYATPIVIPARMQLGSTSIGRGTAPPPPAGFAAAGFAGGDEAAGFAALDAEPLDAAAGYAVASPTPVLVAGGAARSVTVNLSLHAAVIGSRFDVQRAVRATVRDLERLGQLPGGTP